MSDECLSLAFSWGSTPRSHVDRTKRQSVHRETELSHDLCCLHQLPRRSFCFQLLEIVPGLQTSLPPNASKAGPGSWPTPIQRQIGGYRPSLWFRYLLHDMPRIASPGLYRLHRQSLPSSPHCNCRLGYTPRAPFPDRRGPPRRKRPRPHRADATLIPMPYMGISIYIASNFQTTASSVC